MGTFHHTGPISNQTGSNQTGWNQSGSRRGIGRAALDAVRHLWQPTHASFARTVCEPLERRQLLSASVGPVVEGTELIFHGTRRPERINVERTSADTLQFTLNDEKFDVNTAGIEKITILGKGGNDHITVFDANDLYVGDVTINGGGGSDKIMSGAGNDVLIGGGGGDLIQGGGGNDSIDGQAGGDRMIGGAGADSLVGGPGKNVYNTGNDDGDSSDSASGRKNIQSSLANSSMALNQAVPLAVFGTRTGLTPGQIRNQYAFGDLGDQSFTNRGAGQAVAVVIPYDVDTVYTSVNTFSTEFGLPAVNSTNLTIINASGTTPPADPDPDNGWEAEAVLQLSWIHAIAPLAQLYLVLADSDLFTDLFLAVDAAVDTLVSRHGGGVVDMSFGSHTGELNPSLQAYLDQSFTRRAAQTVTFVAGAGDASALSYPAVSPYVVGVGGTSLQRDTQGNLTGIETAWSLGGGGISATYPVPGFQVGTTVSGAQLARRGSPDLAFNADPASGLALFVASGFGDVDGDNVSDSGWIPGGAGGTSAATPLAAGLVALANEQRAATQRGFLGINFNDAIYDLNRVFPDGYFTDITSGASGGRQAVVGYDLVTGNGTPKASLLIDRLASAAVRPLSTDNLEWFGEFLEAINRTGPLAGPGGGFINGTGAISGNNQLTMVLTPRPDLTPTPPIAPAQGTGSSGNNIAPNTIQVTNFSPVTLIRLEDNTVIGQASVQVSILLEPLLVPTPSTGGGGNNPSAPPPPPPPTPIPGQAVAGFDETLPVTVPRITTWNFGLRFTGKIARNKLGREVIRGEFISPSRDGRWDPIQGDEAYFRGTFRSK